MASRIASPGAMRYRVEAEQAHGITNGVMRLVKQQPLQAVDWDAVHVPAS